MIPLPAGVRVWLATGYTDMRKGFPSLALQVQEILHRDPLGGHLFCLMTARVPACSRSAWNVAASCGRARPTGW
jgi:transposase